MNIRLVTMVLAAGIGVNGYAAEKTRVDVYLDDRDDSAELLRQGKVVAWGIFRQIGVGLIWHPVRSANGTERSGFTIRLREHAPDTAAPAALASTRLEDFRGREITIYKDRLEGFVVSHPNLASVAAGYVMAHELAHAMQGIDRHSDSGILKACWTRYDFEDMVYLKLNFTSADVALIHEGLTLQLPSRPGGPAGVGIAELAVLGFPKR